MPDLRTRLVRKRERVMGRLWASVPRRHVTAGPGTSLDRRAILNASARGPITLAARVRILRWCELQGPITIGEDTFVNRDVYIRPGTTIGANVAIGPFTRIVTDSHEIGTRTRRAGRPHFQPVVIGDGAWIGAGAMILGGVTIGEGAVVAAGSVVTRDVPPDTIAAGIPARVVRELPADPGLAPEA